MNAVCVSVNARTLWPACKHISLSFIGPTERPGFPNAVGRKRITRNHAKSFASAGTGAATNLRALRETTSVQVNVLRG